MSRGVSYATGSCAVTYYDVSWMGQLDNGDFDSDLNHIHFYDFLGYLKENLKKEYPSLVDCDEWLSNEDHVILENYFVQVGVSEYCGMLSLWMVEQDMNQGYQGEEALYNLQRRWISKVSDGFIKKFGNLRKTSSWTSEPKECLY